MEKLLKEKEINLFFKYLMPAVTGTLAIGILIWRFYYLPVKMGKRQYRAKLQAQGGKEMVQNVNFFNNHAEMITSGSKMIKLKFQKV